MKSNDFDHDEAIAELERAIRDRAGPEPSDALRRQVISGVGQALSERKAPPTRRWNPAWDLVGWAAVLIVGMTLSQIASSATVFFGRSPAAPPAAGMAAAADLVRQVSPDLTRDEVDRLAIASAWQGELLPIPIASGNQSTWAPVDSHPPLTGDLR